MSEVDSDSNDEDFDVDEWIASKHISEAGEKKLALHEVIDEESLLILSEEDVYSIKLAAADRAKFVLGLKHFRAAKNPPKKLEEEPVSTIHQDPITHR